MSDKVSNALMEQTLQAVQASLARLEATTTRLEKAAVRHDRKFDEHGQRFNAVEASIRDMRDELESIIKLELAGQIGFFQTRVGHRLDEHAERLAAIEASSVPPV